jgi:hypothetical protein
MKILTAHFARGAEDAEKMTVGFISANSVSLR